ncbi:hypothetical protein LCGC14_1564660 [marine sediment metagenome]|uniref:Uncharacterized protein n=1 Tax=marine sediment metagenome TaxID=412755 RepID=A0A0F9L2H6_9ZZZZ
MKELDRLYDWLYDLKENRVSYGKAGAKQIYQEDMDLGMSLYLEVKKKVKIADNFHKAMFGTSPIVEEDDEDDSSDSDDVSEEFAKLFNE